MDAGTNDRPGRRARPGWALSLAGLALVTLGTGTADAQPGPLPRAAPLVHEEKRGPVSSFAALEASRLLEPGDTVEIEDAAGRTRRGRVERIDGDALAVLVGRDAQIVSFSERDVRRITRRPGNTVAKGAAIGAAVGLGLTAAAAASYGLNEGGGLCGACLAQWSLVGVPLGAGVGALVGMATGKAGARTVFVAPGTATRSVSVAPVVGRKAYGAVLSVGF